MINISRFDLNLLVVLNAIYTEGGITRASESLHLTQPAISHALARLRDLLDDPVFVREGQTMVPTPLTRNIIEPVRRALREIEASLNQLQHFDPKRSTRKFKLGVRHVLESMTMPKLAARLRVTAPGTELIAVNHDRNRLHRDLASGDVDVAIDIQLPRLVDVASARLFETKLAVAVREGHPIVRDRIDLETYLTLDHVSVSSRRAGPAGEDLTLARLGHARRVVARCHHPLTALRMIARSDMIATLHTAEEEEFSWALSGIRLLPSPVELPGVTVYAYWGATTQNDESVRWLRDAIIGCFAPPSDR
jgi:DNA-binding transcriptional LysR family regulator